MRKKSGTPSTTVRLSGAEREQQYHHLVRLAWSLNRRGLRTSIDLPLRSEPVLLVQRMSSPLRVMAFSSKGRWVYTWGRGDGQRVWVLSDDAADRVWEAAQ
ncbi:hypothetical protein ABGB17_04935 [Sphaerisporangium sp. B11E5]|uniref:hypothetical protein n=1 Tax=Sphaerisporangium sp. B11E5 TaxID=3153563 RepID=UPI00325C66D5